MSDKKSKERVKFSVGETVIVKLDDKKYSAVFVHRKTDTVCSGSVLKYAPYDEVILEFMRDQVVCNLGENPKPGSVYGQQVEPFFRTTHSKMGTVHFFYASSKQEKEKLVGALDKGYDNMKAKGLANIFPIVVEMRPPKGNFDGHYKTGRKGDPDTMCIRPRDEIDFKHIMYHELGHPIWSYLFTDKIRAKWIRAYHKQVKISKLTAKDCKSLLKRLLNDKLVIKEFSASLEEDNQAILKEIIKHVKKVHSLSQRDLDTMILAGDDITEFWPTTEMEVSEIRSDITDYATKSPEEFACECFAFYMCGKKKELPERVLKLLDKSLQVIAGKKKVDSEE